jgi:hypothetical protein
MKMGIPRLREGELICGACEQPGRLLRSDDRGHLIAHGGRFFPCRVPPDDISVALIKDGE